MSYEAKCISDARDAYATLDAHGGYMNDDDHVGAIEGEALDRVLKSIEFYVTTLEQTQRMRRLLKEAEAACPR